jgi:hypothetical protein
MRSAHCYLYYRWAWGCSVRTVLHFLGKPWDGMTHLVLCALKLFTCTAWPCLLVATCTSLVVARHGCLLVATGVSLFPCKAAARLQPFTLHTDVCGGLCEALCDSTAPSTLAVP